MKAALLIPLVLASLTARLLHGSRATSPASHPPRKLFYVVDPQKASRPADNSARRGLSQQENHREPKLHLNKSFVVPKGHLHRLKHSGDQRRAPKVNSSHSRPRRLNHGEGGHAEHSGEGHHGPEELEDEDRHQKLQSTPLLLIGDYEIIVEKRDE